MWHVRRRTHPWNVNVGDVPRLLDLDLDRALKSERVASTMRWAEAKSRWVPVSHRGQTASAASRISTSW